MDVQMDPFHARRVIPPRTEEDTGEPNAFCQAIGGLAGGLVLIASVVLSASSIVTITFAEQKAHQAFWNNHTMKSKDHVMSRVHLWLAYYSLVAVFMSMVLENIYIYIIIGTEDLSTDQDGPRIKWTRYIKFLLPCYWILFLASEIFLSIAMSGLHREVSLDIAFRLAMVSDILTALLMIYVHRVSVKVKWCIFVRERINALPELRVEADDLDDTLDDCVICLYRPTIGVIMRELPCRHTFHKRCIGRWLIKKPVCPICKGRI